MIQFENSNNQQQPKIVTPYANKGKYTDNINYTQKADYTGRVYDSVEHGKYTVLRELLPMDLKSRMFEVEFHNTSYHAIVSQGKMISGEIKDKYVPSVYGIGYIGDEYYISGAPDKRAMYKIWNDMIQRCYSPTADDWHTYGGRGVRVREDWHNFTQFYLDVKKIPGYENKVREPKMYNLDKDYLQQNVPSGNRIYSKDTCAWVSQKENSLLRGRDNNNTGYFGTLNEYNSYKYKMVLFGIQYARFDTPEEAACLFNYVYPIMKDKKYCTFPMVNNVRMYTFEELMLRNKMADTTVLDRFYEINKDCLRLIYESYCARQPIT